MRLNDALAGMRVPVESAVIGDAFVDVAELTLDSRVVRAGAMFCCVPGTRVDGHDFAAAAIDNGAVALLVERRLDVAADITQVIVANVRRTMGHLAAAVHSQPAERLTMVGVTGTNGKTTVSNLIAEILRSVGRATTVIGTLSGARTTPEAPELQAKLAAITSHGDSAVSMEVSSHALALHRVDGCHFDVSVFTNLGRDHLDLHGTVERYFAAKAELFTPQLSAVGVVNVDDVHGRLLADAAEIPVVTYSYDDVTEVELSATAVGFVFDGVRFHLGIGGRFNVANALGAVQAARALGVDLADIAAGLAAAAPVPGRFEPVHAGQSFSAIVDYAHTPDGLIVALQAARHAAYGGKVIVVFGCGGDRDHLKRPEMGRVAAELADTIVVTSDNPRSEEPLAIIGSIVSGVHADYRQRVLVEPDRRSAIALALSTATAGDVVLVAGKGHETTQTIGSETRPFDDRAVVRELLESMS